MEIAIIYQVSDGEIVDQIGVDAQVAGDGSTAWDHVQRKLSDPALAVLLVPWQDGYPDRETQRVEAGAVVDYE